MVENTTGATFAAQKQESPDAKVLCPSGCCLIIKAYRYCQSQQFCYLRRKYVISNCAKAERCNEYANKRYGSILHRYSSRLGT